MNRLKMKTTATLLIAIFMISTLSVISIGAPADGYTEAVLNAADRLVEMQNTDGGFAWRVNPGATTGPGGSGFNTLGITAMGILKAHELLDKTEYETALAKAYFYATENGVSHTLYYAFPDVTFLIWLADVCVDDTSLFDAIVAEVQGTTIEGIRTLAESIWINRLADGRYGTDPGRDFTTTQMAEYLLVARGSLGFWDLGAAVKAALALGLDADAQDIADVMNTQLLSDTPFDIEDTTDIFYALALSGAIEGFSELGVYPAITRTMTDLLIANQYVAGYWDQGGHVNSDEESVQCTSYAVMALLAQGDNDARVSALEASIWLVDTQNPNGGWYPGFVGATLENLEVDSEAAWALYESVPVAKLPRNIDPLYQVGLYQRMELVLTITGKRGTFDNVLIEGPFYYRGVDDADASWHAVLIVKSSEYPFAEPGDELLCHWKYLDEISDMGWIINAKGFNMHLYPTGPRVGVTALPGEKWRCEQPVEGKSYGAKVTGFLYQIGLPPN